MISAIVSVPLDDGVKFQLKSISEIMDEAEYPGDSRKYDYNPLTVW